MKVAAILLAGGSGSRFGGTVPKQFAPLLGRPVLRWAAEALMPHSIQPVGDGMAVASALTGLPHRPAVPGGATRSASVRAGLAALAADPPDIVLVHDGARPVIPGETAVNLLAALAAADGAIPGLAVSDTLKRTADGVVVATVSRDGLFRVQTPQAFRFAVLQRAHASQTDATDDAALIEAAGGRVVLVPGAEENIKITHPGDLERVAVHLLACRLPRTGIGFDVHRLQRGRRLVLCGVDIPHQRGLAGHSDADVGIHALCDAIYGALAEGDIGRHFPPSQATWRDADSSVFMRHAADLIATRGGILTNADVTLVCEEPRIAPHAFRMRERLATLLGVPVDRISVKATTAEQLGFTGRGEGIAAQAVATVLLPIKNG